MSDNEGGDMAIILKIVEPYYKEFHKRKGVAFSSDEAVEIYMATQRLQENWPNCLSDSQIEPDVVKKDIFYYLRFNFAPPQQIKFRICFGMRKLENGDIELVALTCRTKQELSGGAKDGTQAWYKHMKTVGKARWNDYRNNKIKSWTIY
jgi:hypothetical protein